MKFGVGLFGGFLGGFTQASIPTGLFVYVPVSLSPVVITVDTRSVTCFCWVRESLWWKLDIVLHCL